MGFYRLGSPIEDAARIYLTIVAFGMPFFMLNPVLTAIFNGTGDSATPFRMNTLGLVLNMILDPIFIFGLGPIPRMETAGAAVAPSSPSWWLQQSLRPSAQASELFSALTSCGYPRQLG